MRLRQGFLAWVAAATVLGLNGCAIYSPARDQQGKVVKEAWSKVDLVAQTEAPRKSFQQLYDHQLATEDQTQATRRAAIVYQVAAAESSTSLNSLLESVQRSVELLSVTPSCNDKPKAAAQDLGCQLPKMAGAWRDARKQFRTAELQWVSANLLMQRVYGLSLPTCGDWLKLTPEKQAEVLAARPDPQELLGNKHEDFTKACEGYRTAQASMTVPAQTTSWFSSLSKAESARSSYEADLSAAKAGKKEAEDAAKELADESDKGALANVQKAVARLEKALDVLRRLDKRSPAAQEALAELEQDSLTEFLKTVKDAKPGEDPPPATGKAAAAVVMFANFFDAQTKKLKEAEELGLGGLLLEKRLTQVRLASAQRALKVQLQDVKLLEKIAELRGQQIDGYVKAYTLTTKTASALGQPAVQVLSANDGLSSDIWLGLATYIYAGTYVEGDIRKVQIQRMALQRGEVFSGYESNLQVWQAALNSATEQLALWGASGVKAADISQLVQSAALLSIAHGVNK